MYRILGCVYGILLFVFLALLLPGRKEKRPSDWKPDLMYRVYLGTASVLHRRLLLLSPRYERRRKKLLADSSILYPSAGPQMSDRCMIEQISGVLCLMALGTFLALVLLLSTIAAAPLTGDGELIRPQAGGGSRLLELEATATAETEETYNLSLELAERTYAAEELEALLPAFREAVIAELLDENPSLDAVSRDLSLPHSLDGYPFQITWVSEEEWLLRPDGCVFPERMEDEETEVKLHALCSCGEWVAEEVFSVTLRKRNRDGDFGLLLQESLEQQEAAERENGRMALPKQVAGVPVSWKLRENADSLLLFGLFVGAAVLQALWGRRDLEQKLKRRREDLTASYPEFITGLVLYLGAGLPARAAFRQLAEDRSKEDRSGELARELWMVCREMDGGITEENAYEHFGRRVGLPQYRKCMSLITRNLKKGSAGLLQALQEEAQASFTERKALAMEAGEKAQTKLLFPMMLMLAVVLLLILLPAWMGMNG